MKSIESIRLHARLEEAYEKFGELTHPAVVAISQQLDRVIVDYYRERQKQKENRNYI